MTRLLSATIDPDQITVWGHPRYCLPVGQCRPRRDHVYELYDGRCALCGTADNLTLDHIQSKADGGPDAAANLQLLCGPCNRDFGGRGIRYRPWPQCAGTLELIELLRRLRPGWQRFTARRRKEQRQAARLARRPLDSHHPRPRPFRF